MTLSTLKLGNCGATACQGQAGILVSTVASPLIACIMRPYIIPLRSLESSSFVGIARGMRRSFRDALKFLFRSLEKRVET